MREKWKRGSNSVCFIEKLYRWVQTVLTHYLAGKWQWSGNAEFETRWLTGQDWHGEQENRNPVWPLPNLFANVYIYITFVAGLLPVLQWVAVEALCDITLHQYIVFLVHLDIVHFFTYASKISACWPYLETTGLAFLFCFLETAICLSQLIQSSHRQSIFNYFNYSCINCFVIIAL